MELTLSALLYLSAEVGGGCGEGRRNGDALTHRGVRVKSLLHCTCTCIPLILWVLVCLIVFVRVQVIRPSQLTASITFSQRCAHLIHCHTSFHSSSSGTELTTGSGLVSFIVCFGSWYAIISLGVQVRIETQKWSCWCFVTIG